MQGDKVPCPRHVSNVLYSFGARQPVPVRQHPRLRAVSGSARADSPTPRANQWVRRACHSDAMDWHLYGRHARTRDDYARPPATPTTPATTCDAPPNADARCYASSPPRYWLARRSPKHAVPPARQPATPKAARRPIGRRPFPTRHAVARPTPATPVRPFPSPPPWSAAPDPTARQTPAPPLAPGAVGYAAV